MVLVLALKAAALHGLVTRDLLATLAALPLAHAWSRTATVVMLRLLPYGGDAEHAKAKPLAQQADGLALLVQELHERKKFFGAQRPPRANRHEPGNVSIVGVVVGALPVGERERTRHVGALGKLRKNFGLLST